MEGFHRLIKLRIATLFDFDVGYAVMTTRSAGSFFVKGAQVESLVFALKIDKNPSLYLTKTLFSVVTEMEQTTRYSQCVDKSEGKAINVKGNPRRRRYICSMNVLFAIVWQITKHKKEELSRENEHSVVITRGLEPIQTCMMECRAISWGR